MAKAVINLQKESGGIVKISPVDGIGITEVTVPESGELVTKEYVDAQIVEAEIITNTKISAILPYSGYTQVSKKLDNFVFKTASTFTYKVADENRYVKFGDKVVDTYGEELVTNIKSFSGSVVISSDVSVYSMNSTSVANNLGIITFNTPIKNGSSVLIEVKAKEVSTSYLDFRWNNVYDSSDVGYLSTENGLSKIYTNRTGSDITFVVLAAGSANSFVTDMIISVREIQTADFTDTIPEVAEIITDGSNTTSVEVSAGDYVVRSNADTTDHTNTTYRAKQLAPIGTTLTNTTYFEDRTELGITNQAICYHAYNTLTNAYEGIKTEVLFTDVSKEDLLNNDTWMSANRFSKISEFLYSKGSYLCLPVGIWQSLNKGAYHPVFNGFGCVRYAREGYEGSTNGSNSNKWYESSAVDGIGSVAEHFVKSPNGVLNAADASFPNATGGVNNGRPDGKFYDIAYPDQFIDVREYAKVLTPYEVDLIRNDKEENGISEVVFTEQFLQTTTGTVATLEVSDGTKYKVGSVLQIWNGTTPYRRSVVSVSSNTLTVDATIVKTAVNYIISGGKRNILSSNTKLLSKAIANPTYYSQVMKDRLASGVGIVGLLSELVNDSGTSIIPNGTNKVFKLSQKMTSSLQVLLSTNSGSTWTKQTLVTSLTATNQYKVDYVNNTIEFYTAPASTDMIIVSTTDKCLPYSQSAPLPVIDVEPKVVATNSHSIYKGSLIGNQVSGKIQVGNGANGFESKVLDNCLQGRIPYDYASHESAQIRTGDVVYCYTNNSYPSTEGYVYERIGANYSPINSLLNENYGNLSAWKNLGEYATTPTHSTIALDNSNSPASKWFETLSEGDNGVVASVYGKEMVTNAGVYDGDNDEFDQLTNGTDIDLNGNTVRTFVGHIALNAHIK